MAAEAGGALGGLVRQLSIDQFENEGRRVSYGTPESASHARRLLDRQTSVSGLQKKVCLYFFVFSRLFLVLKVLERLDIMFHSSSKLL